MTPPLELARSITGRLVPGAVPADIDTAYRLGKPLGNRPRPLLIRYVKTSTRDQLLWSKKDLQTHEDLKSLWIKEDANQKVRQHQNDVRTIAKLAADQGINATPKGTKLLYNGRLYAHNELDMLPNCISLLRTNTMVGRNYIAFKGPSSPLSNMSKCKLIDEKGESHQSVEHCLQQRKAEFANAPSKVSLIRGTQCPFRVRAIGKSIHPPGWNDQVEAVLSDLLQRKFTQNSDLQIYLLQSGQKQLTEATLDPKWGAGVYLSSKKLEDRSWEGQNRCGQLLMETRDRLARENTTNDIAPAHLSVDMVLIDQPDQAIPVFTILLLSLPRSGLCPFLALLCVVQAYM